MTLVEMLVATALTLLLMGVIAQLFGILGQGVSDSRSVIELNDQLRMASTRLRSDLVGLTVAVDPPGRPDADAGYFEIVEGPASEADPSAVKLAGDPTALVADCDDLLMFTTRSLSAQFLGRFGGSTATFESDTAEVAWFCKLSPAQLPAGPTLYTLYRRQLLVSPYVGAGGFLAGSNAFAFPGWAAFYDLYDLSVHPESGVAVPNSLGDLSRRENRFMHALSGGFPYSPVIPSAAGSANGEILSGDRQGEDVVLSNVLSFDVRVFDPLAPINVADSIAASPGDPGYANGAPSGTFGCYADIGWAGTGPFAFGSVFPPSGSGFQTTGIRVAGPPANLAVPRTYDTWSTFYDSNGVDEDGDGTIDEGVNGFDDDGNGLVDDAAEQETSPPYPVALRGIEIRIRCYEPSSRQVRQVTVRHTFVPH